MTSFRSGLKQEWNGELGLSINQSLPLFQEKHEARNWNCGSQAQDNGRGKERSKKSFAFCGPPKQKPRWLAPVGQQEPTLGGVRRCCRRRRWKCASRGNGHRPFPRGQRGERGRGGGPGQADRQCQARRPAPHDGHALGSPRQPVGGRPHGPAVGGRGTNQTIPAVYFLSLPPPCIPVQGSTSIPDRTR